MCATKNVAKLAKHQGFDRFRDNLWTLRHLSRHQAFSSQREEWHINASARGSAGNSQDVCSEIACAVEGLPVAAGCCPACNGPDPQAVCAAEAPVQQHSLCQACGFICIV